MMLIVDLAWSCNLEEKSARATGNASDLLSWSSIPVGRSYFVYSYNTPIHQPPRHVISTSARALLCTRTNTYTVMDRAAKLQLFDQVFSKFTGEWFSNNHLQVISLQSCFLTKREMYVQRNGCAKMRAIHRWWQISLCFAFARFDVGFRFFLLLFSLYRNVFSEHPFSRGTTNWFFTENIAFCLYLTFVQTWK